MSNRRPKNFVCFLFFCIFILSCGKEDKSAPQNASSENSPLMGAPDRSFLVPADNPSEAQKLMRSIKVECTDAFDCVESVGLLTGSSPSHVSFCNAFLIDKDTIATNSTCIPEDLRAEDADCTGRIIITFPELGLARAERMECDRISSITQTRTDFDLDFATIKLKSETSRKAVTLFPSFRGNNQKAKIITIDIKPEEPLVAHMRARECEIISDSLIIPPPERKAQSTLSISSGCSLSSVNSGAPVLNTDGSAIGLVKGPIKDLQAYVKRLESAGLNIHKTKNQTLSFITNLKCTQPDTGCYTPNADSTKLRPVKDFELKELSDEIMNANLPGPFLWSGSFINKKSSTHRELLRFSEETPGTQFITAMPSCLEKSQKSEKRYEVQLPIWQLALRLDPEFRGGFLRKRSSIVLRVSVKVKNSLVVIETRDSRFPKIVLFDGTLPVCQN